MEGPSLVILKEELEPFLGKKILLIEGNSKENIGRIKGEKLLDVKTWGKHLLLVFNHFYVRIHFLMFGSYRINEKKDAPPRLSLIFKNGELNFYSTSVKFVEGNPEADYDWSNDIMSEKWDEKSAIQKIRKLKTQMVCEVLMDQTIFSGVGNIIKNEVLFNLFLHPEAKIENLQLKKIKELVNEARDYSFRFFEWKKEFALKKHWNIYRKRICPRCGVPVHYLKTGKWMRGSYFCGICQRMEG